MGTVAILRAGTMAGVDVSEASGRFLAHVAAERGRQTRVRYGRVIGPFTEEFGDQELTALDPDEVAAWFRDRWDGASPNYRNTNRAILTSMSGWWATQPDMPAADPFTRIGRQPKPEDRDRSLTRDQIERLLTDERIPARERLLWSLAYDTAARIHEILALNVEDLDRRATARRARVTRKGGASDVIAWSPRTNRMLGQYLGQRKRGPLFLTSRAAKSDALHGTSDIATSGQARLSYDRAKELFKEHSGGATLHQLRHSALTHLAEEGMQTNMLQTVSGHRDIRSLARYTHPSSEATTRWREQNDPNWTNGGR